MRIRSRRVFFGLVIVVMSHLGQMSHVAAPSSMELRRFFKSQVELLKPAFRPFLSASREID